MPMIPALWIKHKGVYVKWRKVVFVYSVLETAWMVYIHQH